MDFILEGVVPYTLASLIEYKQMNRQNRQQHDQVLRASPSAVESTVVEARRRASSNGVAATTFTVKQDSAQR